MCIYIYMCYIIYTSIYIYYVIMCIYIYILYTYINGGASARVANLSRKIVSVYFPQELSTARESLQDLRRQRDDRCVLLQRGHSQKSFGCLPEPAPAAPQP